MEKIFQDPEIMAAMQKPKVMQASASKLDPRS